MPSPCSGEGFCPQFCSNHPMMIAVIDRSFYPERGDLFTSGWGLPEVFLPTLKRKVKAFRENGIEGLKPAPRSDEGSIRKGRNKTLERAIEIKRANPFRSCFMINLMLEDEGLDPIPESTLQRHFSKRGITVRKLGYEGAIVRKRWTRDHTHSLWVGDFSQGPDVIDEHGVTRKTWISAFIDVHSRFVVAGIYALGCDMDALIRSLLAAFERHGKPKAIYLDTPKSTDLPFSGVDAWAWILS